MVEVLDACSLGMSRMVVHDSCSLCMPRIVVLDGCSLCVSRIVVHDGRSRKLPASGLQLDQLEQGLPHLGDINILKGQGKDILE